MLLVSSVYLLRVLKQTPLDGEAFTVVVQVHLLLEPVRRLRITCGLCCV